MSTPSVTVPEQHSFPLARLPVTPAPPYISRLSELLRCIGAGAIVAVIALRVVTAMQTQVAFATDPLRDSTPSAAFTPAENLLLDVMVLLGCAAALLAEIRAGRGVDWRLIALALLPAPVVFWHGLGSFADLWRGVSWMAAAGGAATIAHLARERAMRASIAAVLVAIMVPLVVRGFSQVFFEHADTVRYYREHRSEVLASQGIEPLSNAARIFERRLVQPEATGWFALANVVGSFMVFGVVASAGLLVAVVKGRSSSGWWGVLGLSIIGGVLGLVWCGSKGAFMAAALGLSLLPLLWFTCRGEARGARIGGWLVQIAVAAALAGVVMRGVLLPVDFASERSVLFRWHYLAASMRIIGEVPLLGAGPGGYQAAYVLHRLPIAPEEVASAHSVFVDWLSCLGVVGVSWTALSLILAWRAGRSVGAATGVPERNGTARYSTIVAAAAMALLAGLVLEWSSLDGRGILLRVVGVGAFIGVATVARDTLMAFAGRGCSIALAAAAAALLAHGQIEMTFTHIGAAGWAMAVLGVTGGATMRPGGRTALVAPATFALVAALVATTGLIPSCRARTLAADAERLLHDLSSRESATSPINPALEAEARRKVSAQLLRASAALPTEEHLPLAAAEQRLIAGLLMETRADFDEALRLAEEMLDRHRSPRAAGLASRIAEAIALRTRTEPDWDRAINFRRRLIGLDPNGLGPHLALADLLWDAARIDSAQTVYRHVLEIDEAWRLDELKQLSDRDRARVLERLSNYP